MRLRIVQNACQPCRFLSEIGLVRIEDQKKELFPIGEAKIEADTDDFVKNALIDAQAKAEAADFPELAAELSAEALQLQTLVDKETNRAKKKAS